MNDDEMREALYKAVYEEFVGPIDSLSEERLSNSPKHKYSAGILYPSGSRYDEMPDADEDEPIKSEHFKDTEDEDSRIVLETKNNSLSDEEEPVALSNADYQSAISMTVAIRQGDCLKISVLAGEYEAVRENGKLFYARRPVAVVLESIALPTEEDRVKKYEVSGTDLRIIAVFRYAITGITVITIALANAKRVKGKSKCLAKDCYFQCSFEVISKLGFAPLPADNLLEGFFDAEEMSVRLLYSGVKNYAIGHGCATDWDSSDADPLSIATKTIPIAEIKPTMSTVPELPKEFFDMNVFSDPHRWSETLCQLKTLCDEYQSWIARQESVSSSWSSEWMRVAAENNLNECKAYLKRMRNGVEILCENELVREAFQLANRAMLAQYLHYSVVANECESIREEEDGLRFWRPFQIAFILSNIESIVRPASSDRRLLDLIWFPTGGGKTEAYLGLSALTLIWERLSGEPCEGTSIIMRYTLRLLSSQQFSRAASLICALEVMRREQPEKLGNKRFTIGFWVGKSASPNNWSDAVKVFESLRKGESADGSIPITQCPWCGRSMGERGEGYRRVRNRDKRRAGEHYLLFVCPNEACDFGDKGRALPLQVVDDEIYFEPPSLLLGTVDKFAMIPYRPESYAIFGIGHDGSQLHAPTLIIQDELHLISGPLGSMTAHYETLMNELCSYVDDEGNTHEPKIVASTATVSRAKEQCLELFGRRESEVRQFPPSGISYADSFFARLDNASAGRRYVGIYAPNISFATASIKLYTQLLWEPNTWETEDEEERDRYWTVVGYYSSTRELGQALTWTASDIPERLYEQRRKDPSANRRYLNHVVELTGRKDAPEVKEGLERLTVKRSNDRCVDLCLATNMISVGLDVPRLGVMVIAGQPKETAEYIQASSRVGRGKDSRGMVFVLYGNARPRDRSHYENFKNYHESFYRHVEPSSVTAFCSQVRQRALAGTLFGLYRAQNPSRQSPNDPELELLDGVRKVIEKRIGLVDPQELEETKEQIDDLVDDWQSESYGRWESLSPEPLKDSEAVLPLMHPYGGKPNPNWHGASFEVPTSMRSVDEECKVQVIRRYPSESEEE